MTYTNYEDFIPRSGPPEKFKEKELVLVGCRAVFTSIKQVAYSRGYKIKGVLDKYYPVGHVIDGITVIGSEDMLLDDNEDGFRCDHHFFPTTHWHGDQNLQNRGLDNGQVRLDRVNLLDQSAVDVISLISPTVCYLPTFQADLVKIGKGVFIGEYTGIASDVVIGDYCLIDNLAGAIDAHLGRNVTVGIRSILSHTRIEDNVRVGVNSTVSGFNEPLIIGKGSTVWNGSNVMKNVPADSMYVPPMGRILSKHKTIQE